MALGYSVEVYHSNEHQRTVLMNTPSFLSSVISEMAVGYLVNGEVAPLTDLGWNRPCGQMYSTVEDLDKVCSDVFYSCNASSYRLL